MSPRLLLLLFCLSSFIVLQTARAPSSDSQCETPSDSQSELVRMRECKFRCWPDIYPSHKLEAGCKSFKRDVLSCCGTDVDFHDSCPSYLPPTKTPCLEPQVTCTHFWNEHPVLWTVIGVLSASTLLVLCFSGLIKCGFTTAGNIPLRDLPAYEAGNQLCLACLTGCNICSGFGVNNNVTIGLEPDYY